LLAVLAKMADPRHRRGVRHRLVVILGLAVCAVLAGARSFTAIAEWATDADADTLAGLGVTGPVPSESTFRRTLQRLDADAFDDLAGQWAQQRTVPGPKARRVIAVDGKTLRGSGHGDEHSRHLLAAFDHAHGVVLGQVEVGAKTNEIPLFSTLLDRMDIAGAVITADALHAQRDHATYLAGRGAHYLLIVKRNQPGLHAQLAALPWRDVPVAYQARERGHGRTERRTLKVTSVAKGLAFPHAAQAIQIVRCRKVKGTWSRETCYAVTSLTITPGTANATTFNDKRCATAHLSDDEHTYMLGSRYTPDAMASVGVGQQIDCGVTYTAPGTYNLTANVTWDACWAKGQATQGGPPANCKPVPGAGGLAPSTTQPVQVKVRDIQSVNG